MNISNEAKEAASRHYNRCNDNTLLTSEQTPDLEVLIQSAITTATADMEREKNCALEQLRIVQQTNANLWSQISAEQRHRMNVDGLVDVLTPLETKIADMERQIGELKKEVGFLKSSECEAAWCERWKFLCAERDTLRQQLEDLKKREEAAAQACFESHCEIMNERDAARQQLEERIQDNIRLKLQVDAQQKDYTELQQQLEEATRRLLKLSKLVWDTRWVSEEQDYQDMVGIAAEINSGNFNGIDKL